MRVKWFYYECKQRVEVRESDFDGDTEEFERYDEAAAREALEDHIKDLGADDFTFVEEMTVEE